MFFHSDHVKPEIVKDLLDKNEATLIDVRTKEEYDAIHIRGARLLTLEGMPENLSQYPDKTKTYIVYCQSGHRSGSAARLMRKAGYTNVLDLGGIYNWPYETDNAK
jgi:rhodanese-related sulfurtransferase